MTWATTENEAEIPILKLPISIYSHVFGSNLAFSPEIVSYTEQT